MELIKNSENYNFNDTTDNNWNVSGSVNTEVTGNINVNINITSDSDYIGDFYYTKPTEGNIHMSYNVSETNKNAFVTYTDKALNYILTQF